MIKEQLFEPFSISVETIKEFSNRAKQNTFFELIYVLGGNGQQCINNHRLSYHTGDLFLMSPQDLHHFKIETITEFFFLRFNDIYLKSSGIVKENIHRLEFTLHNAKQVPGSLLKNETDKALVENIIESMIREHVNRDSCWDKLTIALVNALIIVVARNIEKSLPQEYEENKEEKTLDILQYIHANIYYPQLLKVDTVSQQFGISITYLGRYFKKHTGKTMQDYITGYKIKLIENRLLHSKMRITEIVQELGFADESHLNKFFKKQKGINPSEFRKN